MENFVDTTTTPTKKSIKRIVLVTSLSIVLLGFFIFLSVLTYYRWAINRISFVSSDATTVPFVIPPGETVSSIVSRLEREGLIHSSLLAKVYLKLSEQSVQAGSYQVPHGLSLVEVIELLQDGTFETPLTFIEGWRIEQYAQKYAQWKCEKDTAVLNCENLHQLDFLEAAKGKEGYLFPDTYNVTPETASQELVDQMYANNLEKLKGLEVPPELTQPQLVIFASLVEREAKNDQDRPIVAGILIKRWQAGMALQVDATAQYALASQRCGEDLVRCDNWWPPAEEGLDVNSLYNTRKYSGLPPGPICNPGLSSLQAVANYEQSPYWYYFSGKEGKMYYAVTLEEHINNVRLYQE